MGEKLKLTAKSAKKLKNFAVQKIKGRRRLTTGRRPREANLGRHKAKFDKLSILWYIQNQTLQG